MLNLRSSYGGKIGLESFGVMLSVYIGLAVFIAVEGVNHGRDARVGEFPHIVRIFICEIATGLSDEDKKHDHSSGPDDYHVGFVATGVLITLTRVLTTCDSVGFFTYARTVKYYNTSLVNITGGVVDSMQEGITVTPNNSSVHPYCYFLMSGYVLHNYGFYEVKKFETLAKAKNLPMRPVAANFKSSRDMELALRNLYSGASHEECYTAGWGFPKTYDPKSTQINFETTSEILQTTEMKIVDYDYCYEKTCQYFNDCLIMIWEYGYVCAEAAKGGPCLNDKGAPLICGGHLYAIHNNPLGCVDEGLPRHFVRIDLAFNYVFNVKDSSTINRLAASAVVFTFTLLILRASCQT